MLRKKFEDYSSAPEGSGRHLTQDSFPRFLADVGIRFPVSKDMFQVLDTNDDGVLSWEEVQKLLEWPTPVKRWAASSP